uniref:Uncharacterized protein n=1 Tax=Rousettus aegyptiacus TaxID=9407 RepID=A0A7J8JHF4_ROUAE|nr:hypothetical protein HJG63_010143 [Rousettus aegyptiacus]
MSPLHKRSLWMLFHREQIVLFLTAFWGTKSNSTDDGFSIGILGHRHKAYAHLISFSVFPRSYFEYIYFTFLFLTILINLNIVVSLIYSWLVRKVLLIVRYWLDACHCASQRQRKEKNLKNTCK